MRRVFQACGRHYVRNSSYAAGLFNYKIVPDEMFPFPTHKLDGDESENIQTLIEQIRSGDKDMSPVGARIASEYGGLGLSHTAYALVCEELGMSGDAKYLSTFQHCCLSSYLLSTTEPKELRGRYLTAMSDGTSIMGWAAEEDNGSDISMNATEAHVEGSSYVVSGRKQCPYAEMATHFIVLARTPTQVSTETGPAEARSNSFFVVEKSAKGVTVDKGLVSFDRSPVVDVLGTVGEGFKDRMVTIFTAEYAYSAALLGILKRVVQELRDSVPDKWATTTIASCACITYAMESALYALTANLDRPVEDSLLESALVNAFIQTNASEWLGHLSTAIPSTAALESCFARARKILAMMESCDFLYATAACCGAEDFGLLFQKASTLQMVQSRTARSMGVRDRVPIKEIDCTPIDKAVVTFGTAVESVFVRNTTRLPYQQLLLNRMGESAALLYAASAAVSRASMCLAKEQPTAKTEQQLATAYMLCATERANLLSNECLNVGRTADDSYKRIALELCEDALR